jgi:uncharacterized protein YhaN
MDWKLVLGIAIGAAAWGSKELWAYVRRLQEFKTSTMEKAIAENTMVSEKNTEEVRRLDSAIRDLTAEMKKVYELAVQVPKLKEDVNRLYAKVSPKPATKETS